MTVNDPQAQQPIAQPNGIATTEHLLWLLSLVREINAGEGGGAAVWGGITGVIGDQADLVTALANYSVVGHTHAQTDIIGLVADLAAKQATLVSATNIKTINGADILGAGDLVVSGGATGGSATLAFGAAPGTNTAETIVTGQAGILAGSRIRAWFQADTTADHNAYEHGIMFPMQIGLSCGAVVPGTGFTIYASTELRLNGDIACRWEWS